MIPPTRLVARLLWLANGDPPMTGRADFYAMKARLLARYGRVVGRDVQEVVKTCYGCDGSGIYPYSGCDCDSTSCRWCSCRRCGGTGVYDRFWCVLTRHEFGGHVFHTPGERTWRKPAEPVTIHGRIQHTYRGRAADEAALWLALMYDRRLFGRLMTSGWPCGPTWRYPLCTLRKLTGRLAMQLSRLRRHRCHCGRTYRQYPWERGHWCVCRECRKPSPIHEPEDLPS
jgi:hypothetical protein